MYLKLYRTRFRAKGTEPVIVYLNTKNRLYYIEGGQPLGEGKKTEQLLGVSLNTLEHSFGAESKSVYKVKVDEKDGKPVLKHCSQCIYKTRTLLSDNMSGADMEAYAKSKLSPDSLVDELPFFLEEKTVSDTPYEKTVSDTPYEVAESVADLFGVSSTTENKAKDEPSEPSTTEAKAKDEPSKPSTAENKAKDEPSKPSIKAPDKAELDELANLRHRYFNIYAEYDRLLKRAEVDHEKEVLQEQIKDLEERVDKLRQMVLTHKYEQLDFVTKGIKRKD